MPKCRTCGADIEFIATESGRKMPVEAGTQIPHWKQCNAASQHRRPRSIKAAPKEERAPRCYWCANQSVALCDNPIGSQRAANGDVLPSVDDRTCSAAMCSDHIAHHRKLGHAIVCGRGRGRGCEGMSITRDYCPACVGLKPNSNMPGVTLADWRVIVKQHASGTLPPRSKNQ